MSYNITISNNNRELKERMKTLAKKEGLTLTMWALIELKKAVKRGGKC